MDEQDDELGVDMEIDADADSESKMASGQREEILNDTLSATEGDKNYKLFIIVDTNILLSHLEMVTLLKDKQIKGYGYPVLVIPWIVVEELDALKTLRRNTTQKFSKGKDKSCELSLETHARTAINFLYKSFALNHPRIHGQTLDEIQEQKTLFAASTNDDYILQCCLFYRGKINNPMEASSKKNTVVLFSNDKNLCTKALINGIKTFNSKTILELVYLGINVFQIEEIDTLTMQDVHSIEMLEVGEFPNDANTCMRTSSCQTEDHTISWHAVVDNVRSVIEEVVPEFVTSEFRRVFDDTWMDIVAVKPPWNCYELLYLLQKHWIAVFGNVLSRDSKQFIDLLQQKFRNNGLDIGSSDTKDILVSCMELMKYINCRPEYMTISQKGIKVIKLLQEKMVVENSNQYTDDYNSSLLAQSCNDFLIPDAQTTGFPGFNHETSKTRIIFYQIWDSANNLCNLLSSQLKVIDVNREISETPFNGTSLGAALYTRQIIDRLHSLIRALIRVRNAYNEEFNNISVDEIVDLYDDIKTRQYFQQYLDKFQMLLDKINHLIGTVDETNRN
ncbi:Transcriptional protein SWT1 [Trichoplax sp. H2]|nr:Transcriptional protein SWT1 [Trichoplax sp. H2]|eukprot:RDD44435.1 Transcriptional protein SWT1 [Trichoplax sp. H2]